MSIGAPLPRPDGPAKVLGRALYAADWQVPGLLHAVLVTSAIPAGRTSEIDASGAREETGVIRVLVHRDMPRFVPFRFNPGAAWTLDRAAMRAAVSPKTRAMLLMSPSMPSGAVLDEADWQLVTELCGECEARVVRALQDFDHDPLGLRVRASRRKGDERRRSAALVVLRDEQAVDQAPTGHEINRPIAGQPLERPSLGLL